ncbi:hypothetical protein DPEC_G00000640 [Dallia pectoralis]|uniref:Uncharacterized protein n=1 Tax=Dallia pectoralis TaxID=75939 RepID=A0ACC2HIL6_DALPE|nr:hypothetical protein DPEC_G00000640 [Dallia pectoralis]
MPPAKKESRLPVCCKYCSKVSDTLILHLKQKCMKGASTEDIMAVRGEARQAVYSHIRKGMVVDYNLLEVMLANPVDRLTIVHWLEETDHVVTNKKSFQEIATQHATFITEKKTPAECTTVLNAARVKFLEVFRKANEGLPISSEEQRWYLYYLEALFILKHMQRPAVVRNMTVEEWCRRKVEHGSHGRMSVIGVKENKSGAVATICLDEEEEAWLNTYYRHIRSVFLKNSDHEIDDESERFFINSSGLPIINASNDIRIFQKRNKVQSVSSRQARKDLEMRYFSVAHKGLVEEYLTHSAAAEKHQLLKTTEMDTLGNEVISDIINTTGAETSTTHDDILESQAHQMFQNSFPVTVSGKPPLKKARKELVGSHDKACYDKWRGLQRDLRIKYAIAHFPCRRPSEMQVKRYIDSQDWLINKISPKDVVSSWKPAEQTMEALDSPAILKLVRTQNWKGLLVKDDISKAEGTKRLMATDQDAMGYIFFYRNSRGQARCIDAQTVLCPCHPDRATYGRLINHSRKNYNLKPIAATVQIDGKDQDIIYLKATRRIECDEELAFDHKVRRKSVHGEAADAE